VLHKADYTEMSDNGDAMYRTRGDRTGGERYADTVQNKMVLFHRNTKKKHTITSTLVWLHVSVFPRPSSGQNFSVQGTIGVHYTLWDVVYLQHYEGVYYQLWRYFHYKNFVDYMVN